MHKQSILTVSDWTPYDGNIHPPPAPMMLPPVAPPMPPPVHPPVHPPVPPPVSPFVRRLMQESEKIKSFISKIGGKDYCVKLEQWLNGLISSNICNDEDLILTDY
eukprot:508713_1